MLRAPWLLALTLAAFGGGYALRDLREPPPPPPGPVAPSEVRFIAGRPAAEPNADAIRALVREELATQRPAASPEPAPPASEDQERAEVEAEQVVDGALAAGRWGPDEAERMLALLPRLSPEAHNQLMSRLFPAVNDGRLQVVDLHGGLFDPTRRAQ